MSVESVCLGWHWQPKTLPATAPKDLGLPPGRLSITIRETGLSRGPSARADPGDWMDQPRSTRR